MNKIKATSIDEYIESIPQEGKKSFEHMWRILKEIAPEAIEKIKWGVPVFEQTRILFSLSAHQKHLNFMPTRQTLEHFKEELFGYKTGKDTIQLPYDQPIPVDLIKKLALHRLADVLENDAKWRV